MVWITQSLMRPQLEQTFSFSTVPLPACELDPGFLLINNDRVKCLLVSWRKISPWRTRHNLATVSSEEKYWSLCLNDPLLRCWGGWSWALWSPLPFGLIQWVCVLIHDNHHRWKTSCFEKRRQEDSKPMVLYASKVQELDEWPSNVSPVEIMLLASSSLATLVPTQHLLPSPSLSWQAGSWSGCWLSDMVEFP